MKTEAEKTIQARAHQDYELFCSAIGKCAIGSTDEYYLLRQRILSDQAYRLQIIEQIADLLSEKEQVEQVIKLLESKLIQGRFGGAQTKFLEE